MSKIEEIINEIEVYLDSCKPQAFSNNKKVVVEKDILDEMLAELRLRTPEEIRKYQKIISNQDAIMADAQRKADGIIDQGKQKAEELVSEHEITAAAKQTASEIVEEAQSQAQKIVDNAVNDANAIREGAMEYTDAILKNLQTILAHTIEDGQLRFNEFQETLKGSYDTVTANRKELASDANPSEEAYEIDLSLSGSEA